MSMKYTMKYNVRSSNFDKPSANSFKVIIRTFYLRFCFCYPEDCKQLIHKQMSMEMHSSNSDISFTSSLRIIIREFYPVFIVFASPEDNK